MGSRLGRRVINFANLPIKLLMPTSFSNISEIAIKTIPSASKIEIKRVLESLYGFEVEKVQTLNMEGKKKKRGGLLMAKPDYKKAYVTLRNPLSISPDLYPIRIIQEDKRNINKEAKAQSKSSIVDNGEVRSHWLDDKDSARSGPGKGSRWKGPRSGRESSGGGVGRSGRDTSGSWMGRSARESFNGGMARSGRGGGGGGGGRGEAAAVKFPWSSIRSGR